MVGEQLRYVAECDGRWLALLGWCAAARHLRSRDHWIGWSDEQRRCRLALVANNSRFLILTERGELPNLASRVMRLCLARLSADWLALYAHPIVCVARGQRDLAAYGRTLSQHQLRALGFRPSPKAGGKLTAPSEITLFNILCAADADLVQRAVLRWQEQVLGPLPKEELIAIDGKTLRSARGLEIVNAYAPRSGRWLGSEAIAEGSNEITAARTLIDKLELSGRLVCLDALHTQKATAAQIVQEAGGDYLLSVKGNQPGLENTLEKQVTAAATLAAHSPTGHHGGR